MTKCYTVLIAEDEREIGRTLMDIVNSHPLFNVVHFATDGADALRWIEDNSPPHVLITDIRMPGMDGMTLLKRVNDMCLGLRTVIISGYNSFDYARSAIKYGVSDYLLKPLSPHDCGAMLDSLAQSLSGGDSAFDLSVALNRQTYPLPPHEDLLFLMAACLGRYPFIPSAVQRNEGQLRQLISSKSTEHEKELAFGFRGGIHYLLFSAPDPESARVRFEAYAGRLRANLTTAATLALSRPLEENGLSTAASMLVSRIRDAMQLDDFVVLNLNRPEQRVCVGNPYGLFFELSDELADSIRYHDYTAFNALLREKLDLLRAKRYPVASLLEYVKFQYIHTAQQIFSSGGTDTPPVPFDWENQLNLTFTVCDDWETLCARVSGSFADLFNNYGSVRPPRHIMQEVEQYILTHYTEHITNQSLAKQFGFVPSYISRIFKEYKGVSPCDYLTLVRIQIAQRIIRESPTCNFQEIAYNLGFSDSSYFSKLFKKQVGLTPSEYRSGCHDDDAPTSQDANAQ